MIGFYKGVHTNILIDWLIDWLTHWLIYWFIDSFNQSVKQTRQFLTRRNTAKPLQGRIDSFIHPFVRGVSMCACVRTPHCQECEVCQSVMRWPPSMTVKWGVCLSGPSVLVSCWDEINVDIVWHSIYFTSLTSHSNNSVRLRLSFWFNFSAKRDWSETMFSTSLFALFIYFSAMHLVNTVF